MNKHIATRKLGRLVVRVRNADYARFSRLDRIVGCG